MIKFFLLLYSVALMCLLIIDWSFSTLFGFLYSLLRIAAKCFAWGKLSLSYVKFMYAPYVYFVYLLNTELMSSKKLCTFFVDLFDCEVDDVLTILGSVGFFFISSSTIFNNSSTSALSLYGLNIFPINFPKNPS